MGIAIFYESWKGHTARIVDRLAKGLEKAGHAVVVKRCREATAEEVRGARAVLVASSVQMGRHHPRAVSFVRSNLEALTSKPSAFVSVSLAARAKTDEEEKELETILSRFETDTGWKPSPLACIPGAIQYTKYWFLLRWVMRSIARSKGNATDTTRDHVYTDWDRVDGFAAGFAEALSREAPAKTSRG